MKIARVLSLGCGLFAVGFGLLAQQARAESTYQVKPGDSLWRIARQTQGKGSAWRDLFALNKDKIRDPDKIRPGQQLALPNSPPSAAKPAASAQVQPTAGQAACAPLGIPMDAAAAKYRGSNTFFLCKENILTGYKNGNIAEISIACRPESLRAGWKWKIWCNADGTHCGCNENDAKTWLTVGGSATFAAWNAGEHCTMNGQAQPGKNGCASW